MSIGPTNDDLARKELELRREEILQRLRRLTGNLNRQITEALVDWMQRRPPDGGNQKPG